MVYMKLISIQISFIIILLSIYSCKGEDISYRNLAKFPNFYEDTNEFLLMMDDSECKKIDIGRQSYNVSSDKVFPEACPELLRPVFRIPSLVITNDGTKLVACENRDTYDDKGEMDIVVSRKILSNEYWEVSRVWKNNNLTYGRSMNPVFVIDRMGAQGLPGRVFLFVCHFKQNVGYGNSAKKEEFDIVYKYSDDDGMTWSPEYSIKNNSDLSNYDIVVPAAANGIQLADGTLVVPTMSVKDGQYHSGIVYLDSKGEWIFSSVTPYEGDNECTVYIDQRNITILDCRTSGYIRRKYSYNWKKRDWRMQSEYPISLNLKAEITKCNINGNSFYLTCFCDTDLDTRENLTLFGSVDAIHWKKICLLQKGQCHLAYSNVAVSDTHIAVVLETVDWGIRVIDLTDIASDISLYVTSNIN